MLPAAMTKRNVNEQVLSVMVSGRAVHAALLDAGPDGTRVLRRFMRQRASRFSSAQTALPEIQNSGEDGSDFSIQFGEGTSSVENMFLGSEFAGVESSGLDLGGEQASAEEAATIVLELGDILAECRDAGYANPVLTFCVGAAEVNQVELRVAAEKKGSSDKAGKRANASRSQLLELLAHQHKGEFKEECVAFLPMTPTDEGIQRYLAVFPKAKDVVASTLRVLREQLSHRMPAVRLMDTETSVYMGLARAALNLSSQPNPAGELSNTLIVRAGSEDTLVLFMQGDMLLQSENLRSLTAYEAPETICSRVLLLQDEYGISDVEHVLLLSEEREDDLVESFEMFFPDARVDSMRKYVPQMGERRGQDGPSGGVLPAVITALRIVGEARYQQAFADVNLLPKQLLRRRLHLPVTWHVLALYVLLFITVLFFTARYFSLQNRIDDHQRTIAQLEEGSGLENADAQTLQARIDSLQAVHARYMRAIGTLEELLQGSDQWSRALEKTSVEVAKVTGIWIESWTPRGDRLQIVGNATARDRVVDLAERLEASITSLTFSEIRDWPVYSFEMNMPVEKDLPEAARYLREQVAASQNVERDVPVTSTSLDNTN